MINKRLLIKADEGLVNTDNFNTVLYTGNGSTQSITSVGFQPDLVWTHWRNTQTARHSCIYDSVRGATNLLASQTTGAEASISGLSSFDSNGFTLGSWVGNNESGSNWVAWCWKAGGAAVSNTDGTITSQVSANQAAGFSIVKYTGNAINGATIGHGLSSAPELIIIKNLIDVENWSVYSSPTGNTQVGHLNLTNAFSATGDWNNTTPTTSVFTVGTSNRVNTTDNFIAYCFHSVDGYQKVGSYTGATAGVTVTTGFQPRFIMVKRTSDTGTWLMFDSNRDSENPNTKYLRADVSNAEADNILVGVNFISNGFEIPSTTTSDAINWNGSTYIYLAIA